MSVVVVSQVVRQKAQALSAGISIVRRILQEHQFPDGFTTKQLFELSKSYTPPPNFESMSPPGPASRVKLPPRPDHPIRSITFLKTTILPALAGQQEIKTISQPRSGIHPPPDLSNLRPVKQKKRDAKQLEFVWKVVPQEERKLPDVEPEKKRDILGENLGLGADISHLNKRRQNARVKKVTEAILNLRGRIEFTDELEKIASTPQ